MSSQVSSTRKLVSASALMASGTLISRALGLVRVMLIAFILGNGTRQADMLQLATMVPNSLYILFAGGALNTVLVPQIVRHMKSDGDDGEAYTNRILTAFMLIVGGVAVAVTIAAPVVMSIYSSSAWREPALAEQYASMVALAYLTLPQIFFYGAFFLLGQILNARDKFGPMMWAPIANNVISIAVLSTYLFVWGTGNDTSAAFTTQQILLLGIGSTLGIVVQTAVLIPFVRAVGFKLRPRFDLKGTGLGKTFSLTKWTVGFVAVNQLALMVVNRLATSATATGAGAGANVYANAHLIWILPHSLITVSLATAMLPNASRLAAAGKMDDVAAEAIKTIRLALILIVPAAVGFFAMAPTIASLLFGHGEGSDDAQLVAWALIAFSVGLIPFTIQFVCLRTFYALEDTRTPFLLQLFIAGSNAVFAILFVGIVDDVNLVAAALALAYSVAYLLGVFGSWQLLKRRAPAFEGRIIGLHLARLLLGVVPGGVLAAWLSALISNQLGSGVIGGALGVLAGLAVIGVIYLGVGKALKVREFRSLGQLVRTRGGRGRSTPDGPERAATQAERSRQEPSPSVPSAAQPASLTEDLMPTQLTPVIDDSTWDTQPSRQWDDDQHGAQQEDEDTDEATDAWERESSGAWSVRSTLRETDDPPPVAPQEPETGYALPPATRVHDSGDEVDPDEELTHTHSSRGTTIHPAMVIDEDEDSVVDPIIDSGTLLSTRFRVEELLTQRSRIETWRAHDLVLSRDVLVHVLAPGDPRMEQMLAAARKGAVATDSRFLRVLDAIEETDPHVPVGGYIVCEFVHGASLTALLTQQGPLSALEAAWIVRELADAMASMHAEGLFHEQINPDNIVITTSGAVRLVGFGLESAMSAADPEASWREKERDDVRGLAKVLYAALVSHYPEAAAHGLPAAPIIAGETAPPHWVRSGVSPALDRICSAALTERGAASQSRITTASQLTGALNEVLGSADASLDLEHRVRDLPEEPAPPRRPGTSSADARRPASGMGGPQSAHTPAAVAAADLAFTPTTTAAGHQRHHEDVAEQGDAVVPLAQSRESREGTRMVMWIMVSIAGLALIIALAYLFGSGRDADDGAVQTPDQQQTQDGPATDEDAEGEGEPDEEPEPATPGETYSLTRAIDFDPSPDGNDEENPDLVDLAIDGDPETGWPTLRYHNRPDFGGLKDGVGLIVDLGEPRAVGSVELLFDLPGASVQLRAPTDRAAIEPPMSSAGEWDVLSMAEDVAAEVTLTPATDLTSQYLMVFITNLPPDPEQEARYRAQINDVSVYPPGS